ncbi:uncharacterized protein LOC141915222 [Tubulanus polymorphus]|uniref:uncharacterized protein LOC141915222 n=1 Tax=Tubulanus polymorphus TaxID=672921 RepID=UPI003DA65775
MKVSQYRLSPNEVEKLLKEEHERRKKLRIIQVREQSKARAAKIRTAVKEERERQLRLLEDKARAELEAERQEKIKQLENEYERCLKSVGEAHTHASDLDKEHKDVKRQIKREKDDLRARKRHVVALKKEKIQNDLQKYEETKTIIARQRTLEKERERSAHIASLPPPKPDPVNEIEPPKHKPVTVIDAFSSTYFHLSEEDYAVIRAQPEEQIDARLLAEEEGQKYEDELEDVGKTRRDFSEKANLRGKHALHKEVLKRDYGQLLLDLSDLQRKDRERRQKIVHNIPRNVFQPPHRHLEEKMERQHLMEMNFEDMYTEQQTDKFERPALLDITNESQTEGAGLKHLLDKVKKQQERWIHETDQQYPDHGEPVPSDDGPETSEEKVVATSEESPFITEESEVTDVGVTDQPSVSLPQSTTQSPGSTIGANDSDGVLRHPLEEAMRIRQAAQRQIQSVDKKLQDFREERAADQPHRSFLNQQHILEQKAQEIQLKIEQLEAKRKEMEEKESQVSQHLMEISQHPLEISADAQAEADVSSVSSYLPPAIDERLLRIRRFQNDLLVKHQLNQSGASSASRLSSSILSSGSLTPPFTQSASSYMSPVMGSSPTLMRPAAVDPVGQSNVIQAMAQMASLANRLYQLSPRGREYMSESQPILSTSEPMHEILSSGKYSYSEEPAAEKLKDSVPQPPSIDVTTKTDFVQARTDNKTSQDVQQKLPSPANQNKQSSPETLYQSAQSLNILRQDDIKSPQSMAVPSTPIPLVQESSAASDASKSDESIKKRKEDLEKQLLDIQNQKQEILNRHSEIYDNWTSKLQEWMKPLQSGSSTVEASSATPDRLSTSGEQTLEIDEKLLEEIDKLYDSSPESEDSDPKRIPPPVTKKVMFRDDIVPHELSTIQEVETPQSDRSSQSQSLTSEDARRALEFYKSFEKIDQSTTQSGSGNDSILPQSELSQSPIQKSPSLTSDVSPSKTLELSQHPFVPSPQGIQHDGSSQIIHQQKTINQSSSAGSSTELSQYSMTSGEKSVIQVAPPTLHYDEDDTTESVAPSFTSPFAGIDETKQQQEIQFAPLPLDMSVTSNKTADYSQHPILTPAQNVVSARKMTDVTLPSPPIDLSAISSVSPAQHHETTTFYGTNSLLGADDSKMSDRMSIGEYQQLKSTSAPSQFTALQLDASLASSGRTLELSQHPISTPSSSTSATSPASKLDETSSPFYGNISVSSGPRFQPLEASMSSFLESSSNKRSSILKEKMAPIQRERFSFQKPGESSIASSIHHDTTTMSQHASSTIDTVSEAPQRYSLHSNLKWADILKSDQTQNTSVTTKGSTAEFRELHKTISPSAFTVEKGLKDLSISSSSPLSASTSTPASLSDQSRLTTDMSLRTLSPSIITTLLENTNWKSELSQFKVTPSSRSGSSLGETSPDSLRLSMKQLDTSKDLTQYVASPGESDQSLKSADLTSDRPEASPAHSTDSNSKADLTQYAIQTSDAPVDTTVRTSEDEAKITQHPLEVSESLTSLKSSSDEGKMSQYPLDTTEHSSPHSEIVSLYPLETSPESSSVQSEIVTQYKVEDTTGRTDDEQIADLDESVTQHPIDSTVASTTIQSDEVDEQSFKIPALDNSGVSTVQSVQSGSLASTFGPVLTASDSSTKQTTASSTSLWLSSSNSKVDALDDVDGPINRTEEAAKREVEVDVVDGLEGAVGYDSTVASISQYPLDDTIIAKMTENSSKWLAAEDDTGILEEPDMTFSSLLSSSTIHDSTLTSLPGEEPSPSLMSFEQHELSLQTTNASVRADQETDSNADSGSSTKTSADRKKTEKEMLDRNKRIYNKLEEVKQKRVEQERQKQYAENRQKAKEFQKKVRESLLKKKT